LAVIKVGNSTSNKGINKFINDAIEKEIIKPYVENVGFITTEDSPSLSTTSFPDIPKDSVLSKVIEHTESLSTPPPQHSGHDQKLPSYFALSTFNDTTTKGSINIAFVAIANKPRTY